MLISGYAEYAAALFHRGSRRNITADSLVESQLAFKRVLLSERAMGQVLTGMSVQGFSNLNDAFETLENGSIDYVACDAYAGAYLATNKIFLWLVSLTFHHDWCSVATSNKALAKFSKLFQPFNLTVSRGY